MATLRSADWLDPTLHPGLDHRQHMAHRLPEAGRHDGLAEVLPPVSPTRGSTALGACRVWSAFSRIGPPLNQNRRRPVRTVDGCWTVGNPGDAVGEGRPP